MKAIKVTVLLAVVAGSLAINVVLGGNKQPGIPSQGKVVQFPGAPGQLLPQQGFPAQAAPVQAAPAQASPAQAGPAQGAPAQGAPAQAGPAQGGPKGPGFQQPGGLFGLGGFNFNNLGNFASKFVGDTPSFDDLIANSKQASGSPVPAANASPINAGPANAGPANSGPANAAPVRAAPINAAPINAAPVGATPRRQQLAGGFNFVENCAGVRGASSPFQSLSLASNILKSFVDGQASGATSLGFFSSQVVAGSIYKAIFKLNDSFLGLWVFVGLNGAAPVIKQVTYSETLNGVLAALGLDASTALNLGCSANDIEANFRAASVPAAQPQGQNLGAPQNANNQPSANDLNNAAIAGLGMLAPGNGQQPAFQAPAQQPNFQATAQQPGFRAPGQVNFQAPAQQPAFQANGQQPAFQAPAQQPAFQAPGQVNFQAPAQQPGFQAPAQQPAFQAAPKTNFAAAQPAFQAPAQQPGFQVAPNQQNFGVPSGARIINIGSAKSDNK